ncbi:CHASE3 domain sensor protein [Methylobacterium sp. RAS18]|nr:CHASE3 domain sensor protein [Methylobacterium sp. RAS18]
MPITFGLNRTLGSAIGAIALVSVLSSGAVLNALNQLHDATEARRRVVLVLLDLDAFRATMLNQETGVRGYLLTGRDSSLEPYRDGRAALNEVANRLRAGVGADANAKQSKLLEEAIAAAQAWQNNVGEVAIRLTANPATQSEAVRIEVDGKGKQFFDTLRDELSAIEIMAEENRLMQTERLAGAE